MTVIASADAVEMIAGSDLHRACELDESCRASARSSDHGVRISRLWLTRFGTACTNNISGSVRPINPRVIRAVGLRQTVSSGLDPSGRIVDTPLRRSTLDEVELRIQEGP